MSSTTYCIITYGCQMNDHDSEIMDGLLAARGMRRVDDEFNADLVVYNTCCVREGAEARAMARCESLSGARRKNPDLVVAMTGCVAQDQGTRLLEKIPHLDLVLGTRDFLKLPDLAAEVRRSGQRFVAIDDIDQPFSLNIVPVRKSTLKAHVNITYGCNNHCTFCIVPRTRGQEFSRPLDEIVAEVRGLVAQGYREVMLLGQNVNSYRDPSGPDFADLLRAVNDVDGLWRIRYTTSNPKDCRDRHISAVAECEKVMEHLHLPVQSGSDRVLRAMKRSYNARRYRQLSSMFREANPVSALTTDIIVGFPTETADEFEETYRLAEEMRWDMAFTFVYSPRKGTPAAEEMQDDVPLSLKKERLARLIELQERISGEINASMAGQEHEILVEGLSRRRDTELVGRTRTDKSVVFPGGPELIGQRVKVHITGSLPHTLFGELVGQEAGLAEGSCR